jgi:hypothetical protein
VVLLVIIDSKFTHGAWFIVLLIPALVWMFRAVHRHYIDMRAQVVLESEGGGRESRLRAPRQYKVVVPISSLTRASLAAVQFARSISRDVTAVLVDVDAHATARVEEAWSSWALEVPLVVLKSPYRAVVGPLLTYLEDIDRRDPEHGLAVVILPEIVPGRWWQHLLHNQTTLLLKAVLLFHQGCNGEARVVINVPYHLRE